MSGLPTWLGAILSALMIISILALSDRFSRHGLAGWKTALFGIVLVFLAFLARAVVSIENVAQLFIPGVPAVVSEISEITIAAGAVIAALSLFVALRRVSAEREIEKEKESELRFLDNLKTVIFEPYTLVEVLNLSLHEISRALGDCRGAIFIYNPSSRELYLTSSVNLDKSHEAALEKIGLGGDIVSRTQKVSRSHAVGKLSHSDKSTQMLLSGMHAESAIAAPLMSRGGAVGVILTLGETPYRFSRRESEVLGSAANLLGPVVMSFRMEREIRRLRDEISATGDVCRRQLEVVSALDCADSASDKLAVLLEHCEGILHSDGVALAMMNGSGEWRVVISTDESPFDDRIPDNFTGHFDKAVQNGKPMLVRTASPDTSRRARFLIFPVGRRTSRPGILVAPIPTGWESFSPDEISGMQLLLRLVDLLLSGLHEEQHDSEFRDADFATAGEALLSAESKSELGDALARMIYSLLPHYDAGMLLANETGARRMRVIASFGYDGNRVNEFRLRAGAGPWGAVNRLGREGLYSGKREIEELFLSLAGEELSWFMERSSSRKLPVHCTAIPLSLKDRRIGILFLEGSGEPPERHTKSPARQLLLDLLAYKLRSVAPEAGIADGSAVMPAGHGTISNLNQLNNALTGIIGKAQLLGFGLKDAGLADRESVLLNLDMIADEAFQAGELIKRLQRVIREESAAAPEGRQADLSDILKRLTIVRYGDSPDIHYLRENPEVSFKADLKPMSRVHGDLDHVRTLVGEVLQWVWDEFDVDEHMHVSLLNTDDYTYMVVSDHPPEQQDMNVEDLPFRPLGLHPDLSQSELIGADLRRLVSFHDKNHGDDDRLFCLRFSREAVPIEQPVRSLRVLAIDDQEIIRELLTGMLDQLGYDVTVCSTGIQGVEAFRNGDYDLIITDIGLPDIDGWEVVERIKKLDADVPIIMISGWGLNEEVEKAGRLGVDHILPKPFRLENLGELIEKVKSRRATA